MKNDRIAEIWAEVVASFRAVDEIAAEHKVVDIPIGLLDVHVSGGRECDQVARALLGKQRRSSVFTPPIRPVLAVTDWAAARAIQPMTMQTFAIISKVAEVERSITRGHQARIHEGHPEVTFWALSSAPMTWNKKTPAGQAERLRVLRDHVPNVPAKDGLDCEPDDLIDACAMLVTGVRLANGHALFLTAASHVDSTGLTMDISA